MSPRVLDATALIVAGPGGRGGSAQDIAAGRAPAASPAREPVGVRHAVPRGAAVGLMPMRSLCGLDATGWLSWPDLVFTGRHPGDCQRCHQVSRAITGNATR